MCIPHIPDTGLPSSSNQTELVLEAENDCKSFNDAPLSFICQLKVGFLKLFKFNYISTIMILLQLVYCEGIHDRLHLYMAANHICYIWWQWLIIFLLLPPFSFGFWILLIWFDPSFFSDFWGTGNWRHKHQLV